MTSQLARRIAFTLGALFVYRLGAYIPVPGIDSAAWVEFFGSHRNGILGQANIMSGGAVRSLGLFSLALTPYLTVAIFLQLLAVVSSRFRTLSNVGERGHKKIELYTRCGAAVLAASQAYGIASGLERIDTVVPDPGPLFVITTVLSLTGGMLFLVWLSAQITARGIGNGIALILFTGIVAELPRETYLTLQAGMRTVASSNTMLALLALLVAVTAIVVTMERARRRLTVRFPARVIGEHRLPAQSTDLAYKLNPAGIMPTVVASWLMAIALVALTLAGLAPGRNGGLVHAMDSDVLLHLVVYAGLTMFLAFVYTAAVCDPQDAAAKLQSHGATVDDVAPGAPTAVHLDTIISRLCVIGAPYVTVVVVLPDLLSMILPDAPLYVGGVWLLILVCVTLDIEAQIRGALARPAPA